MFGVWGITQPCIDVISKCMVVLGMEQVLSKMLPEKRLMTDNDKFHAGNFKNIGVWKKAQILCTFSFPLTRSRVTNMSG